jgi:hypothetical protein
MVVFFGLLLLSFVSSVFCAITIRRLYVYINKYKFDESVYTLLFGFVRVRYIVSLYIFMVALAAVLGLLFAFNLLSTGAY